MTEVFLQLSVILCYVLFCFVILSSLLSCHVEFCYVRFSGLRSSDML